MRIMDGGGKDKGGEAERNNMTSTEKRGQNQRENRVQRKRNTETRSEKWVLTKALFTTKSLFLPNIHPRYSHTHCPLLVTINTPSPPPPGLTEHRKNKL